MEYFYGVLDLSFWGYVLTAFILIEITVLSVTLYLHRDAAHRALDLHPAIRHFCRFWLWFTTGITTREWVAIHRKHHARCETPDDPHSPQIEGLKKVLLEGAELYKLEARNQETLEKYGRGCPDDWVERNVYLAGQAYIGIALMVVTWLILFGVPGLIMIAVQLVSQPLLAAGIINGVGHHTGYRNFECADASRNVVPWGVFLGGEELHNNHHAFPSSAKFSIRPWEFDIGWATARVLSWMGLAKIRRVAPHPELKPGRSIDLETARAVIVNRMHVLRTYTRSVTIPVMKREMVRLKEHGLNLTWRRRRLVIRNRKLLDDQSRGRVTEVLNSSQAIKTVDEFRQRLQSIWEGAAVSNERLVAQLKEWCQQAEASGERVLQDFARSLRSYTTAPTAIV